MTAIRPTKQPINFNSSSSNKLQVTGALVSSTNSLQQFEEDVLRGLSQKQKTLPCKYFYDARGSELFEAICQTEEYYVTRTELGLLRAISPQLAMLIGPDAHVLEPGSGAGEKIRILLDALHRPNSLTLIDISESAVRTSAEVLAAAYPELVIHPLVADFTQPLQLPEHFFTPDEETHERMSRKLIFFPGSTISNFTPEEAVPFLRGLGNALGRGDFLLIGVDREKDPTVLQRAYNDRMGITAAFNLNLLHRIKNELGSDIDPGRFRHRAVYNRALSRIEMYLDSAVDQVVRIGQRCITFRRGESVHTENSYKYSPKRFAALMGAAGYKLRRSFSDRDELFSLYLCEIP